MDKQKTWEAILDRLADKISRMEFHAWFKKVNIREISGGAVLLACPTEMNRNWLENRWHNVLLSNIRAILPEITHLYYEVDLGLADRVESYVPESFRETKPRKLPNRPEVRHEGQLDSRVVQNHFTLNNFVVGTENRFAHATAIAVAETPLTAPKRYNPLYLYGDVGLGKTHLLQGIANEMQRRNPHAKIIYTTAERFTNEMIKAISSKKTDALRRKYRRADALLIDDVQFFANKEKTQIELFNTFNDLRDLNKQMVFSADCSPAELQGLSDRLTSRLGWGITVDVQMPGQETRAAIVQQKASEMGLILPLDVQAFIAANIRRNLRDLENILNRISMELEVEKTSPTVPTVGKIFRTIIPDEALSAAEKARTTFARSSDDVITIVSDYFQVPATDLLGVSRKQSFVFPRQVCWYLCKELLKMSFDAIGQDFGGKNHTTIMHGINKIKTLARKDSGTARHLHALKKDLGAKV